MHGRRYLIKAGIAVIIWLFAGTLFYYLIHNCSDVPRFEEGRITTYHQCPWTFGQAFYFSVQTGLSIGFGLLAESKKGSMVYSCFHILLGSSVISGALAMFASLALSRQHAFQTAEERRIAQASRDLHTDCYDGFKTDDLKNLMVSYPHYANAIMRKTYRDAQARNQKIHAFDKADNVARQKMAKEILVDAAENVKEFKKDKVTLQEIQALEIQTATFSRKARAFVRQNRNFITTVTVFALWIAIGTIFSCVADENDFITGIYFAISTCSTAGMVSVKTVNGSGHVVFAGIFALIGVPIYCAALGLFANVLVDQYSARQLQEALQNKLTRSEKAFLDHMTSHSHCDEVDFSEFLEFQLLRVGVIDKDMIDQIQDQWKALPKDNAGKVRKDNFLHVLERTMDPTAPAPEGVPRAGCQAPGQVEPANREENSVTV